ncbi:hypothetical protein [Agrococcus baldri]|uniref:Uncharacterized protein n=1 Tax=Agrococcus baldri TaxID=153730 RepID=A0AA87RCR1_9MICO|nr:hypothetical protein [Agrococcus baldri]GEK80451.1 hypothetical protein ABA31_18020 [Agrococcus baldri]
MATTTATIELEAAIVGDDGKGSWTYVLLPGSEAVLGTGRSMRIAREEDGR